MIQGVRPLRATAGHSGRWPAGGPFRSPLERPAPFPAGSQSATTAADRPPPTIDRCGSQDEREHDDHPAFRIVGAAFAAGPVGSAALVVTGWAVTHSGAGRPSLGLGRLRCRFWSRLRGGLGRCLGGRFGRRSRRRLRRGPRGGLGRGPSCRLGGRLSGRRRRTRGDDHGRRRWSRRDGGRRAGRDRRLERRSWFTR